MSGQEESKPIETRSSANVITSRREGRRVVVTGLGIISPIGNEKRIFTESLRNGKNGTDTISFFEPSQYPCQIAAEVRDFDASLYMNAKSIMRTGRPSQFAVVGAHMAVEDSGLDLSHENRGRIGVVLGSAVSGLEYASDQIEQCIKSGGKKPLSPYMGIIVFAGACSK